MSLFLFHGVRRRSSGSAIVATVLTFMSVKLWQQTELLAHVACSAEHVAAVDADGPVAIEMQHLQYHHKNRQQHHHQNLQLREQITHHPEHSDKLHHHKFGSHNHPQSSSTNPLYAVHHQRLHNSYEKHSTSLTPVDTHKCGLLCRLRRQRRLRNVNDNGNVTTTTTMTPMRMIYDGDRDDTDEIEPQTDKPMPLLFVQDHNVVGDPDMTIATMAHRYNGRNSNSTDGLINNINISTMDGVPAGRKRNHRHHRRQSYRRFGGDVWWSSTSLATNNMMFIDSDQLAARAPGDVSVDVDDEIRRMYAAESTGAPAEPLHWPVKKESVMEGDLVLGGLMMVHSREDTMMCGPIMPQGGIQALEAMLYTLDRINRDGLLPNITIGAHILDDCDRDSYGLEMAVDFIKGE